MRFTQHEDISHASKQHTCAWCGEDINIKERYFRYRYFDDRDAGTVKLHPECYDTMMDMSREEGSSFYFTFGSQERPSLAQPEEA